MPTHRRNCCNALLWGVGYPSSVRSSRVTRTQNGVKRVSSQYRVFMTDKVGTELPDSARTFTAAGSSAARAYLVGDRRFVRRVAARSSPFPQRSPDESTATLTPTQRVRSGGSRTSTPISGQRGDSTTAPSRCFSSLHSLLDRTAPTESVGRA